MMKRRLFCRGLGVLVATGRLLGAERWEVGRKPEGVLRIVTYNIRHGRGLDGRLDLARTVRVLGELDADLIALQEVDCGVERSGRVDQPRWLGERLGVEWSFQRAIDYEGGQYGVCTLSRLPVLASRGLELPPGREERRPLEVEVEAGRRRFSFVNLHFSSMQEKWRIPQAHALLKRLKGREHPVILAGDFNATPGNVVIQILAKSFRHVPKEGPQMTAPANAPQASIDHFMVRGWEGSEGWRSRVLERPVTSDHRPVVLDVAL